MSTTSVRWQVAVTVLAFRLDLHHAQNACLQNDNHDRKRQCYMLTNGKHMVALLAAGPFGYFSAVQLQAPPSPSPPRRLIAAAVSRFFIIGHRDC